MLLAGWTHNPPIAMYVRPCVRPRWNLRSVRSAPIYVHARTGRQSRRSVRSRSGTSIALRDDRWRRARACELFRGVLEVAGAGPAVGVAVGAVRARGVGPGHLVKVR